MSDDVMPSEEVFKPVLTNVDPNAPIGLEAAQTMKYGRADVMKRLTQKLPINELGLPNYIYRTDLIPATFYDDESMQEEERVSLLSAASLELDYLEGYPSQLNGTPFWAQLSFEPVTAFTLFVQYLGVVQETDAGGHLEAPVRTLTATKRITKISEEKLREMAFLYYWPLRAKAHDLFMVANFQKQRENRALHLGDTHYRKASEWSDKAEKRLVAIFEDEDELMDMKPKEVFNMMKELMQMQRIAVGLPANGPAVQEEGPRNASMEISLRSIAQKAGELASEADNEEASVESMLNDPKALEQLQKMIILTHDKGER